MLIDNKHIYGSTQTIRTVWDCIAEYSSPEKGRTGRMDIVTGFFSIAALHILYTELSKDNKYRIVLGDIHDMMRDEKFLKRAVDLFQGDSALESGFQLPFYARNAVTFLKQASVEIRTINNTFCHAKSYLFEDKTDAIHDYGIVGSSNLTEAGLGIKESANVELNMVETGRDNATVRDLRTWFKDIWEHVAATDIPIPTAKGKTKNKNAKAYIIEQIERMFKAYTPEEIYYKILFEFFKADIEMNDSLEYKRDMEFLQKSKVWQTLYSFQQSGVVSLVKLLTRYGGAILADAVGLGKTFSALGVIKYFQNNGYHTIVFCPKKLRNNWTKYLVNANSRFEEDRFNYVVRCHTDLQQNRLSNYSDNITKSAIQDYEKLLVVVDESHNLRNDKSCRYNMLLDDIINESAKRGHTVKVLLLSATPINTGLKDIRNQFKLIGYDENRHFYNEFKLPAPDAETDILRTIFQQANSKYTEWASEPNHTVNTLRGKLSNVHHFFTLTDELIIARNRAFVTSFEPSLQFPSQLPPQNEHVGVQNIGKYRDIDAMYDDMKILRLTAYQPTQYNYELKESFIKQAGIVLQMAENQKAKKGLTDDEELLYTILVALRKESNKEALQQIVIQNWIVKQSIKSHYGGKIPWDNNALRELSLAGMMISLFIKRLESCWDSCLSTLTKVRNLHEDWLERAMRRASADFDDEEIVDDEGAEDIESIGKRTIDFAKMKRIEDYVYDLKKDIAILNRLIANLEQYGNEIKSGSRKDEKLETLKEVIRQRKGRKVVVFTSYADTAQYLYDQINGLFADVELVTGDIDSNVLEGKLERFAPYSKLFMEKKWDALYKSNHIKLEDYKDKPKELYAIWKELIFKSPAYKTVQEQLLHPVTILVATDCVSEGQNLQDADTVVNYDVHWNPVRLIQRFGRIDRIGSPNNKIQSVNFWPSKDIESYLGLSERVSNRMVAMNVAGSETLQANETIAQMEVNNQFRQSQDARSLKSIHDDQVGEIEDMGTPTFDLLSLSEFKADAEQFVQNSDRLKELEEMPNGAFSGFRWNLKPYADFPECLVALLRHRDDNKSFHLLCLPTDEQSAPDFKSIDKAEVLKLLADHKKEQTFLPQDILAANPKALKRLARVITGWFAPRDQQTTISAVMDLLNGNPDNVVQGNRDETIEERTDIGKYDLIAWDLVSEMNHE